MPPKKKKKAAVNAKAKTVKGNKMETNKVSSTSPEGASQTRH